MSRSTRFLPTRMPLAFRRARTFRWPSPRKSLSCSTSRISSTNSSSLSFVFGPRFFGSATTSRCRSTPHGVDRRAGDAPHLADHRQRIAPSRRRTHSCPRFKSFFSSSPYPLFSRSSLASSSPHRQLPELRPGSHQLAFGRVPASLLQPLRARLQEHPPPLFQLRRRDLHLPAHLAQILASQEPQDHLYLALCAPPLRRRRLASTTFGRF